MVDLFGQKIRITIDKNTRETVCEKIKEVFIDSFESEVEAIEHAKWIKEHDKTFENFVIRKRLF